MEATRFRKKPVVIEAIQLLDDDDVTAAETWIRSCGGDAAASYADDEDETVLLIHTLEGTMVAKWSQRDWVLKGVQGEFYPCKPSIFEQTYEPAEAEIS